MYDWAEYLDGGGPVRYSAPESVHNSIVKPFRLQTGAWMIWMGTSDNGLWDVHFDSDTVFTQDDFDAVRKDPKPLVKTQPAEPDPITQQSAPQPAEADPITQRSLLKPDFGRTEPKRLYEGTDGNDVLIGDDTDNILIGYRGRDTIYGGAGDDFIRGGKGHDIIHGGAGDDILVGGKGFDTFIYTEGVDIIFKFDKRRDTLLTGDLRNGIDFQINEIPTLFADTVHMIISPLYN